MFANVGPACYNYDETLSTLRYANRAKSIKNNAKINEDPKDALMRQYQKEIEELRRQLKADGGGEEEEEEGSEEDGEDGESEEGESHDGVEGAKGKSGFLFILPLFIEIIAAACREEKALGDAQDERARVGLDAGPDRG